MKSEHSPLCMQQAQALICGTQAQRLWQIQLRPSKLGSTQTTEMPATSSTRMAWHAWSGRMCMAELAQGSMKTSSATGRMACVRRASDVTACMHADLPSRESMA